MRSTSGAPRRGASRPARLAAALGAELLDALLELADVLLELGRAADSGLLLGTAVGFSVARSLRRPRASWICSLTSGSTVSAARSSCAPAARPVAGDGRPRRPSAARRPRSARPRGGVPAALGPGGCLAELENPSAAGLAELLPQLLVRVRPAEPTRFQTAIRPSSSASSSSGAGCRRPGLVMRACLATLSPGGGAGARRRDLAAARTRGRGRRGTAPRRILLGPGAAGLLPLGHHRLETVRDLAWVAQLEQPLALDDQLLLLLRSLGGHAGAIGICVLRRSKNASRAGGKRGHRASSISRPAEPTARQRSSSSRKPFAAFTQSDEALRRSASSTIAVRTTLAASGLSAGRPRRSRRASPRRPADVLGGCGLCRRIGGGGLGSGLFRDGSVSNGLRGGRLGDNLFGGRVGRGLLGDGLRGGSLGHGLLEQAPRQRAPRRPRSATGSSAGASAATSSAATRRRARRPRLRGRYFLDSWLFDHCLGSLIWRLGGNLLVRRTHGFVSATRSGVLGGQLDGLVRLVRGHSSVTVPEMSRSGGIGCARSCPGERS